MKLTVTDVLREIKSVNNYAYQIAKKYHISRQAMSKRLKRMIELGFIVEDIREGEGKIAIFYKLTPKGLIESRKHKKEISKGRVTKQRSISNRTEVYIHSFRIKFPLIKDESKDFWEEESDLAYGKKYYRREENFTLEKVFNNIIIHLRFPIESLTSKEFDKDFETKLYKNIQFIVSFCTKYDVKINSEIKKDTLIEFAINDPITQILRKVGARIGEFVDLNRLRDKIFTEGLDQKAWAKYDSTPEKFTRETNDRVYVRKVLDMPETLDKMGKEFVPAIKKLTEQIELHLEVQRETLKALKQFPKEDGWKTWRRMM